MIRILLICLLSLLSSPGLLLAREVVFYHTDNVGTPVAMTNSAGAVVWRAHDKPFGEEFQTTATPHNSRRFIGKEKDKETGLVYIGARYLDPASGRFLQPDPVGPVDPMTGKVNVEMLANPQRLNRYAYGLNNPYRYIDPDGKDIALSVDPKAAGGNGHTSLFFQNKEGQWHSYDQGTRGATSSGNGGAVFLMGLDAPAGVTINPVNNPPKNAFTIKSSPSQDAKITQSALQSAQRHNSGKIDYNLYTNNCTDAAVDVINNSGAGITVKNPALTVKPNSWIKELKDK